MSADNESEFGVGDSRVHARSRTAAVVLAGGAGSRFQASVENADLPNQEQGPGPRHKLLVEFRGAPLVSWAIEAAHTASFERLYVISGAVPIAEIASAASGGTAVVVENDNWRSGQASSLAAAIDAAQAEGFDAVVIGLGDQPLVPAEAWRAVAKGEGPIVVASFGGKRRPPVKLDKSVWNDVPRDGDEGARNLFRLRPELVSEISCAGNPVDIDTIEDLDQWN